MLTQIAIIICQMHIRPCVFEASVDCFSHAHNDVKLGHSHYMFILLVAKVLCSKIIYYISRSMRLPTMWYVRPAKP